MCGSWISNTNSFTHQHIPPMHICIFTHLKPAYSSSAYLHIRISAHTLFLFGIFLIWFFKKAFLQVVNFAAGAHWWGVVLLEAVEAQVRVLNISMGHRYLSIRSFSFSGIILFNKR